MDQKQNPAPSNPEPEAPKKKRKYSMGVPVGTTGTIEREPLNLHLGWQICDAIKDKGDIYRAIQAVAQTEDEATLGRVREALEELIDWIADILEGKEPGPAAESPLVEILQRLDSLEGRMQRLERSTRTRPQINL